MHRSFAGAVVSAACILVLPSTLRAQLLSPGRLAEPHAELEGLRSCTSCHQLGKAGVSAERCLSCHEEVRVRMDARRGYHATLPESDCASCHQDHLGEGFALVRFDEASLDHAEVGFALERSHAELACRSCHEASFVRDPVVIARKSEHDALDRTFLGLPADCAGCHQEESPHGAPAPTVTTQRFGRSPPTSTTRQPRSRSRAGTRGSTARSATARARTHVIGPCRSAPAPTATPTPTAAR
jgi:hypothetical protein